MKLFEITDLNNKVLGPFKVTKFDPETREVSFDGFKTLTLDDKVLDKPTVGYNQSFKLKDQNTIGMLVNQTVDLVIHTEDKVLLIKRKNSPFAGKWAIPGGFIDPGESPEDAAKRELDEETGVKAPGHIRYLELVTTPNRDPRAENSWSYVYVAEVPNEIAALGSDDAITAEWKLKSELKNLDFAFDHNEILKSAGVF